MFLKLSNFFSKKVWDTIFSVVQFILLGMLAHGILLLSDGILSDDWMLTSIYNDGSQLAKQAMLSNLSQHGMFLGPLKYFFLKDLPQLFFLRSFQFGGIILTSFLFYKILMRLTWLSPIQNKIISFIYLTLPVVKAYYVIIFTRGYYVQVPIFLFSFYLLLKKSMEKGPFSLYYRMILLFLFFVSFQTYSLLFLYLPLLIVIAFKTESDKLWFDKLKSFFRKYLDFALLPILFLFCRKLFFMPYGQIGSNYHTIPFHPLQLIFQALKVKFFVEEFVTNIIPHDFLSLFPLFLLTKNNDISIFFIIPLFFIIMFCGVYFSKSQKRLYETIRILLIGSVLFFLGALPYALIDSVSGQGWFGTRFLLLVCFGGSLIIFGLVSLLSNMTRYYLVTLKAISALLIILFCWVSMDSYLILHTNTIIDSACIKKLELIQFQKKLSQNSSIIAVKRDIPYPFDEIYKGLEWNGLFKRAFNATHYIGYSFREGYKNDDKISTIKICSSDDLIRKKLFSCDDFSNAQASKYTLVIKPGVDSPYYDIEKPRYRFVKGSTPGFFNRVKLSIRYWFYGWFNVSEREVLLDNLVVLHLIPDLELQKEL